LQFIDLKRQKSLIENELNDRISTVLSHGKFIMGPEVYELENKLAEYVNRKHCISCSSGTDALLMPLMALGIGPGDAVITTSFSYIATSEVIRMVGATPIFIDIYKNTFNIDSSLISDAVSFAKECNLIPKAIIPVDLFGLPARYRLIQEESKKYGLTIIEDSAQGFGGRIRDSKSCSFGEISTTSFFPAKPLGCYGDGGAIFTDDDNLAEIMRSIRVHGSGTDKYDNIRQGINGRLDTMQAAILLEKFNIFPNEIKKRNNLANIYHDNISNNLIKPFIPNEYLSSWAQYSIISDSKIHRKKIIDSFEKKNIPIMVYYIIPLHKQTVNNDLTPQTLHISEDISDRIFSIPMHPYLNDKEIDIIVSTLNEQS
tara:strand:- start:70 stop:1182 length:1113 start_codon:yes stop_codon:yes gene_type:complete